MSLENFVINQSNVGRYEKGTVFTGTNGNRIGHELLSCRLTPFYEAPPVSNVEDN
jgi:hypothetical protein